MADLTPAPPPDHYIGVGRVVSAFSMLELQIGLIGWAAQTGERWTENWHEVASAPRQAYQLCKDGLTKLDEGLGNEVRVLLSKTDELQRKRNRFSHAVFILDPTRATGEQWILRSPKDEEFRPLTLEESDDLVRRINRLSRTASELRFKVAQAVQV